jgi:hypothetical protein
VVVPRGDLAKLSGSEFRDLDEFGYYLECGGILLPCSNAHLMNHSCDAAVLDFGLDFAVAVRDIAAGEEVTCDYRTFSSDSEWEVQCRCGTAHCCGTVCPADGADARLHGFWRQRLAPALDRVMHARQPLAQALQCSGAWRSIAVEHRIPEPEAGFSIRNPEFLRLL